MRATAPGRVNLIGDHTDYAGGLALPMAIDLGTTVALDPGGAEVRLTSSSEPDPAVVPLDVADPAAVPGWGRYVAGVVAEMRPAVGGTGSVTTTLPVGAGLSSSAALELSVALALGFEGTPMELAKLCQRAENRASGVPTGLLDQIASAHGGATLVDFTTLEVRPVEVPPDVAVVVVHSGVTRTLAGSAYADRRRECAEAAERVGPLASASPDDVEALPEPLRRRARHVVTENARVRAFAAALAAGDFAAAGAEMDASHASLAGDFEVSVPQVDALVARLRAAPGVHGVRMTGGGFGGCVVALAEPGALDEGWTVRPVKGAHRVRG